MRKVKRKACRLRSSSRGGFGARSGKTNLGKKALNESQPEKRGKGKEQLNNIGRVNGLLMEGAKEGNRTLNDLKKYKSVSITGSTERTG